MITLQDLQTIIAGSFFDGNTIIAGIMIYIGVLALVFCTTKKPTYALIIALPVTYVFSILGILSNDVMILLIIVTVLGLAYTTRDVWRD